MPHPPAIVLVVDNDELSRDLLVLMLESEGLVAHAFPSGEAALEALRSGTAPGPDAIATGLQMPGLTGNPLALELRKQCGTAVHLLAISATQPVPEAIAAFDGFLLKPFTSIQLVTALESPAKPELPL